jgi:hypothetical protein
MKHLALALGIVGAVASTAAADTRLTPQEVRGILQRAEQSLDRSVAEAEERVRNIQADRDKLAADNDPQKVVDKFGKLAMDIGKDLNKVAGNYAKGDEGALENGKTTAGHAKAFGGAYGDALDLAARSGDVAKERSRLNGQLKAAEQNLKVNQQVRDYVAKIASDIDKEESAAVQGASEAAAGAAAAGQRRDAREARERADREAHEQHEHEAHEARERTRGAHVDIDGPIEVHYRDK